MASMGDVPDVSVYIMFIQLSLPLLLPNRDLFALALGILAIMRFSVPKSSIFELYGPCFTPHIM